MSVGDLRNLQDQIKQEMKKREHQEVAKAREQILAIAQSVGVPLKDLIGSGVRAKTGTVAVPEMGQGMGRRRKIDRQTARLSFRSSISRGGKNGGPVSAHGPACRYNIVLNAVPCFPVIRSRDSRPLRATAP
eukprot:gene26672-48067_t